MGHDGWAALSQQQRQARGANAQYSGLFPIRTGSGEMSPLAGSLAWSMTCRGSAATGMARRPVPQGQGLVLSFSALQLAVRCGGLFLACPRTGGRSGQPMLDGRNRRTPSAPLGIPFSQFPLLNPIFVHPGRARVPAHVLLCTRHPPPPLPSGHNLACRRQHVRKTGKSTAIVVPAVISTLLRGPARTAHIVAAHSGRLRVGMLPSPLWALIGEGRRLLHPRRGRSGALPVLRRSKASAGLAAARWLHSVFHLRARGLPASASASARLFFRPFVSTLVPGSLRRLLRPCLLLV